MANANQLICLTTFEYSSLAPTIIATHCPSCGFRVDVRQDCSLLNRYSPVIVLIGASAYILYKISGFSPKMKRISNKFWQILGYDVNKLEPVFFLNTNVDPLVEFNESKLRNNGFLDTSDVPDLDLNFSPNHTPRTPFWSQLDSYLNNNHIFSDKYSPDFSPIDGNYSYSKRCVRNGTVAKIDEVLTQIDDIKKSIVEIDSQIFDFSGSKCVNFNPDFFTLTNTDLSEEYDDISAPILPHDLKDSDTDVSDDIFPSTPTQEVNLEWDETDSLYYSGEELEVESALSLPVTDSEKQRLKSMQELLEEAKQMGLLNNILDAITCKVNVNKSRDSAYFED